MSSIGQNIHAIMEKHNMTFSDLAKLTNLKPDAIRNIIYGRSKKLEHIYKIAQAFGKSIEALLLNKQNDIFKTDMHMLTLEIIHKELIYSNIAEIPSFVLQEYIESVYNFLIEKNEPSSAEFYLKGKIETQLKFGIIKNT